MEPNLTVTEIQRFCMHDGPGIRTTVFLKGCPLHCVWCHNPETQASTPQLLYYPQKCLGCGACAVLCSRGAHRFSEEHTLVRDLCVGCGDCTADCPTHALELCGKIYSQRALLAEVKRDIAFYGKDGGVTLSGGEPFAQPEGALGFLSLCKEAGISTAVETSGAFSPEICASAAKVTDLFLFDIKDTDASRLARYTGGDLSSILSNLRRLDALGAKILLRCILVRGVNDTVQHYQAVADLAASLRGCVGVEVLPYHAYGGAKWIPLGGRDNGKKEWIPSEEETEKAMKIMNFKGNL